MKSLYLHSLQYTGIQPWRTPKLFSSGHLKFVWQFLCSFWVAAINKKIKRENPNYKLSERFSAAAMKQEPLYKRGAFEERNLVLVSRPPPPSCVCWLQVNLESWSPPLSSWESPSSTEATVMCSRWSGIVWNICSESVISGDFVRWIRKAVCSVCTQKMLEYLKDKKDVGFFLSVQALMQTCRFENLHSSS